MEKLSIDILEKYQNKDKNNINFGLYITANLSKKHQISKRM